MKSFSTPLDGILGTAKGRAAARKAKSEYLNLSSRFRDLSGESLVDPFLNNKDSPIFIFSAGWRSGATLLQRMLMEHEKVLVWGEPFDRACIVQNLADRWRGFTGGWPPRQFFIKNYQLPSQHGWIANLYPPVHFFKKSQISMLNTLFREPAVRLGYETWGIKETRWTIEHAWFLKWLYPKARFLFICRNPFEAYKSYKPWRDWFRAWPEEPVLTPKKFGEIWSEMVEGFAEGSQQLGGSFVAYEELEDKVPELEEYLGFRISRPSELPVKRGKSGGNPGLNFLERLILREVTAKSRKAVGY